jgi:copper homeostasis protein
MLMNRRDFTRALLCGTATLPSVAWEALDDKEHPLVHLEVIASSLEDARAAYEGGATRLEVAVHLEKGGFTPPLDLVKEIFKQIPIPLRIMLRENEGVVLAGVRELAILVKKARTIADLNVNGIITGFAKHSRIDLNTIKQITDAAPSMHITIHNVIDMTADPVATLRILTTIPSIDRALVYGGKGTIPERIGWLKSYKRVWENRRRRLIANSFPLDMVKLVRDETGINEFHFGNDVRTPEEPFPHGKVDAQKVKKAREALFRL